MWSANTIPQLNNNSKFVPMQDQGQNRTSNFTYPQVYKTPIKQSFFPPPNGTPFQLDINFYFGNLWSSGHFPMQFFPSLPQSGQSNRDGNVLYRTSMEKSGFKFTPGSDFKPFPAGKNILGEFDEHNGSEPTKKNLSEIFNNVRNEDNSQQNFNMIPGKNLKKNSRDNKEFDRIPKLSQNVIIGPNIKKGWNEKIKNKSTLKQGILTKIIDTAPSRENLSKNKDKSDCYPKLKAQSQDSKNFKRPSKDIHENRDKAEFMFCTPGDKKKPKKLFECSGSTMNTDVVKLTQKKRRFRKNNEQLKLLTAFYEENKQWTKTQIQNISNITGLKENKVYKWLWDQRNKEYKATKFVVNKNDE